MSITKRLAADGKARYLVRLESRDPVTGRRARVTVGTFHTKKEAQKAHAAALTARERGTLIRPDDLTVADLLRDWLRVKADTLSPNSLNDYEGAVRLHLAPALGNVKVQTLRAETIQRQYTAWREAGMSARLIRRCHVVLSQALDQAVRFGVIPSNPAKSVTPPRIEQRHRDVWDAQQVTTFLDAAEEDSLWPLWPLLVIEGLRRGEALGLRWADVDFTTGVIHIVQTIVADKTNHGAAVIQPRTKTRAGTRSVRLTTVTLTALRDHRTVWLERRLAAETWQDTALIVGTGHGGPVNPNNVSRSFARLLAETGLPPLRVHDLRHTSATLALAAGVPLKVVSERLGHAGIAITADIYGRVTADMQEDATDRLDALLSGT